MKLQPALVKKAILIVLIVILFAPVQAQETSKTKNSTPIFLGISLSPDYSFRKLTGDGDNSSSGLVIRSRNDLEIAKFGYTTSVNIFFTCSKQVGFETGIQFSNKGYKTKSRSLIFGTPNPDLATSYTSRYSYQYIGIPLKARFTYGDKRLRMVSGIGFVTSFLIQVKQTNFSKFANGTSQKENQTSSDNFNRVDLSPLISLGFDYRLTDRIYLCLEPTFRYGLLKTMDAPVREHLWSGGINLGFYCKLNR